ncbi:MAG TPA: hypothetical protein VJN22_01625 [Candidatus Eremiobacteraceae bacterium]|nr:hypothetical protein [Candidatus Eremiobacteraceae bacterium]
MKISARQVRAVLDAYLRRRAATASEDGERITGGYTDVAPGEIRRRFELLPEERDIVVHDLRAKIRAGSYFVSSSEIVDALLGRLAAGLAGK